MSKKRVVSFVAALFVALGIIVSVPSAGAYAGTVQKNTSAFRLFTLDCGFATCSIYFTRNTTRHLADMAKVGQTMAAACADVASGSRVKVICKAIELGSGTIAWKAREAASKNQCLRVRFLRPPSPPQIVGLYSSGNRFCRN